MDDSGRITGPGGALDAERRTALKSSLVDDAFDFMVAIRDDFVIAFASGGIERMLGNPAEEFTGRSVADFVHPDDVDRALIHMDAWETDGMRGGTTVFRLRQGDGSYSPFDCTAAKVTDGVEDYLAVYCRPVDYQLATDEILQQLLNGGSRESALRPCLDVFAWEFNGSQISIAWYEPGVGHRFVSTGLPEELTGASTDPGASWATARAEFRDVLDQDWSQLEPELAAARSLGRSGYWVVPVADAGTGIPALVTVWADQTGRPDGHAYGMTLAQSYIEVILRWSTQVSVLNRAARHDPLTSVANRNALFDAIARCTGGGALLYCDLDHFKPVNDAHGHAAGDAVLYEVARRFERALAPGELIARHGGDEFVVLCPGADEARAGELAAAIVESVEQPLVVNGIEVAIGVTIGVAHTTGPLSEDVLAAADRALLAAKSGARGSVRWAQADSPDTSTQ